MEIHNSTAASASMNFSGRCWNLTRNPQPGTSMYYVGLYWAPLISVLGIFGNALNVVVLNSKGMRTKTNCFLSAMAGTDLCFFMVMFVFNLSVYDSLASSDSFMRIYFSMKMTLTALASWFSTASIWIAIAVTVERLIAIRRPLHARLYWNSRRIALILVAIFVGAFVCILHNWFWMWPIELPRCSGGTVYGLQLLKKTDSLSLYTYVWVNQYLAVLLTIVGPVVALMVLNSWLVYSLRQNRREMAAKLSTADGDERGGATPRCQKRKKGDMTAPPAAIQGTAAAVANKHYRTSESKVAIMVFAISALFIIFELPSAILYMYETVAFLIFRSIRPSWFQVAAFYSNQLVSLNKALNFCVYCGAGQHFRRKFLKLICSRFSPKRFYDYGSRYTGSRFYFTTSSKVNESPTGAPPPTDSTGGARGGSPCVTKSSPRTFSTTSRGRTGGGQRAASSSPKHLHEPLISANGPTAV